MLLGKATKLLSQFRLTYNMILNLLRVEALRVEEMIKRSFSENSAQKAMPEKEKLFAEASSLLANLMNRIQPDADILWISNGLTILILLVD